MVYEQQQQKKQLAADTSRMLHLRTLDWSMDPLRDLVVAA